MNITTAIVHDHQRRAKEGQEAMLAVRITANRRHIFISTDIKVRKSEWIAGKIVNRLDANVLNERLAIIYNKVGEEVNACLRDGVPICAADIRRRVSCVVEDQRNDALLDWIAQQIPALQVREGTRKHYVSLLNRLDEYGQMRSWNNVTTEDICAFDAWLHSLRAPEKSQEQAAVAYGRIADGLSDGAVYTYHKCLKALLNRARLFGRITENPYDRLRGKFKRGERESVEYLTDDEIQRIIGLDLPSGQMKKARDLFVFQLFSGLAYSDSQAFDIKEYRLIGGTYRRIGSRIKTGVPYVSQLLPPVVAVLKRYGNSVPKMNNSDYNRCLKAIGVMAHISIPLHSHLARHTFATMMLRNGAKIENVSRMLGHTNIQQTQRYAKVLAMSVHEDFDNFRKKCNVYSADGFT